MTELEAVQALQSPLSGPSLRIDAERVLIEHLWPELAIRLARRENLGPATSLGQDVLPL